MIRLLYISNAAPTISGQQLQDILASARRNNPAKNITGVLVHGGGLFMQVLEGPEKEVLRQYVKILDDPRHSDARIIHVSPANNRLFDKWSWEVLIVILWTFSRFLNFAPVGWRLSKPQCSQIQCAGLYNGSKQQSNSMVLVEILSLQLFFFCLTL